MTSTIRKFHIIPLLAAVLLLGAYHFTGAAWTSAPSNPPNNNARPPIHVGGAGVSQAIQGGLGVDNFVVTGVSYGFQKRSDHYCDRQGNNCFHPSEVGSSGGLSSCSVRSQTVSCSSNYCSSNPNCPWGWWPARDLTNPIASGGSYRTPCLTVVCQ